MPEKKTMSLAEAKEFIVANIYKVTAENKKCRCVDGRKEGDDLPAISIPGADAGYVLTALAAMKEMKLDVSPNVILEAVEKNCGGVENFQFHTDEHAVHDGKGHGMGCGHLKAARENSDAYGLDPEKSEYFFGKLPEILEQGAHETVLTGNHAEQMTLVINSAEFAVKPKRILSDGSQQQAFVYHQTLDNEMLEKLSVHLYEALRAGGLSVEQEDLHQNLIACSAKQRAETLKRLTAGLPRYLVKIDSSGEIEVSLIE